MGCGCSEAAQVEAGALVVGSVDHGDLQLPVPLGVPGGPQPGTLGEPDWDEQAGGEQWVAVGSSGEGVVFVEIFGQHRVDGVELLVEPVGELAAVVERVGEGEEFGGELVTGPPRRARPVAAPLGVVGMVEQPPNGVFGELGSVCDDYPEGVPGGVDRAWFVGCRAFGRVDAELDWPLGVPATAVDPAGTLGHCLDWSLLGHAAVEVEAQGDFQHLGGDDQSSPAGWLRPARPFWVAGQDAPFDRAAVAQPEPAVQQYGGVWVAGPG